MYRSVFCGTFFTYTIYIYMYCEFPFHSCIFSLLDSSSSIFSISLTLFFFLFFFYLFLFFSCSTSLHRVDFLFFLPFGERRKNGGMTGDGRERDSSQRKKERFFLTRHALLKQNKMSTYKKTLNESNLIIITIQRKESKSVRAFTLVMKSRLARRKI